MAEPSRRPAKRRLTDSEWNAILDELDDLRIDDVAMIDNQHETNFEETRLAVTGGGA